MMEWLIDMFASGKMNVVRVGVERVVMLVKRGVQVVRIVMMMVEVEEVVEEEGEEGEEEEEEEVVGVSGVVMMEVGVAQVGEGVELVLVQEEGWG